jgi:hypothetical protein
LNHGAAEKNAEKLTSGLEALDADARGLAVWWTPSIGVARGVMLGIMHGAGLKPAYV